MSDTGNYARSKLTANIKAAGCAAKISAGELASIIAGLPALKPPQLLTGMDNFEDAAVYQISDDLAMIQTTDFFPPPLDDPYLFGRIAAVNALSDVYAMGGTPVLALNILCFPTCDFPPEVVQQVLRGGADVVMEAGACLAGGHSIQTQEPVYGLSVTGLVHPQKVLTNGGAHAGDVLVLSKPIGTGASLLGLKGGQLSVEAEKELIANLTTLNNKTLDVALRYTVHAATDITGFGLIGHIHEMARASKLACQIFPQSVLVLSQAAALAAMGLVPAGAYANRRAYASYISYAGSIDDPELDLLFDPQTAGGLLLAVDENSAEQLVQELKSNNIKAAAIGQLVTGKAGWLTVPSDFAQ